MCIHTHTHIKFHVEKCLDSFYNIYDLRTLYKMSGNYCTGSILYSGVVVAAIRWVVATTCRGYCCVLLAATTRKHGTYQLRSWTVVWESPRRLNSLPVGSLVGNIK